MTRSKASNPTPAGAGGNASPFVAARIFQAAILLRRSGNRLYGEVSGLSASAARVMLLVGDNDPLVLSDLADLSSLDPGQISRVVAELERDGLLLREKRGRQVWASLSDKGGRIYERLLAAARRRDADLLQDFTRDEAEWLLDALDRVAARARAQAG